MFNERTWKDGEKIALEYMKKQGYKILYTNFKCAVAELDIVAELSKRKQLKVLKKEYKQKVKNTKTLQEKDVAKRVYLNEKSEIKDILIITEVKSRENDKFGTGVDAVSSHKKGKLILGAKVLLKQRQFAEYLVRFDVASVDAGKLTYIENAIDSIK